MLQADSVKITILVDNWIDMLLRDVPGRLSRYGLIEHFDPRRPPPQAENGISFLVEATLGGKVTRVLFDVGLTGEVLEHNMRTLGVDPSNVDQVVISHGHPDHFGGIHRFLGLAQRDIPVVTHADAELPRYAIMPDGRVSPVYNAAFDFLKVERSGGSVVRIADPLALGAGIFTTGEIPRTVPFETQRPPFALGKPGLYQVTRSGNLVWDEVMDEIGLVVDVKDVGIVVLTGCAHAGVINTIRKARETCGDKKVVAVMGGFHLGFPTTPADNVNLTIEAFQELDVGMVMPMHCSGLRSHVIASQLLGDRYVQPAVGTVVSFAAGSTT